MSSTLTSSLIAAVTSAASSISLPLETSITPSPTGNNSLIPPIANSTQPHLPFTLQELGTFQIVLKLSATLSFIGALAIILSYKFQARFRTAVNKLIYYTSFGELALSSICLIGDASVRGSMASPALCTFQGFMVQYTISATMWWSLCMALHALLVVIYRKPVKTLENFFIFYCIISWGLPLVSSFLVMSLGNEMQMGPSFGDNYIYCWIASPYKNWRLYSYYIPLWIIFFGNIAMYYAVVRELQKMKAATQALRQQADLSIHTASKSKRQFGGNNNSGSQAKRKAAQAENIERGVSMFVLRTFIYVAMFFVNWFVPSINRVQGIIAPQYPNYVLFIFHSFSVPCGGFLNAIVYFSFAAMADPKHSEDDISNEDDENYNDDDETSSHGNDKNITADMESYSIVSSYNNNNNNPDQTTQQSPTKPLPSAISSTSATAYYNSNNNNNVTISPPSPGIYSAQASNSSYLPPSSVSPSPISPSLNYSQPQQPQQQRGILAPINTAMNQQQQLPMRPGSAGSATGGMQRVVVMQHHAAAAQRQYPVVQQGQRPNGF